MVAKSMRFVLAVSFTKSYRHQSEFLSMLRGAGLFSTACQQEKYFGTISAMLLRNEDPSGYIDGNEPFFPGTGVAKVVVSDRPVETDSFVFVCVPGMTGEQFRERALELAGSIKRRYFAVMQETTGLRFYKKYLGSSLRKKELAESFFYFKEYQQAVSQFSGIAGAYPEYSARMIEWCKFLMRQGGSDNRHIFDILILNRRVEDVYFASKVLPKRWRRSVECWLSTKDLLPGQKLLVLYGCFCGAVSAKDTEQAVAFLNRIRGEINTRVGAGTPCERHLWEDVYGQIEAEIKTI